MVSVAALVHVTEPFIGAKEIAKCSNIEVPSNNLYTTHLQEVMYLRNFLLLLVL